MGAGNDYIYVNTMAFPIQNPEQLAIQWSAPHTGIGSDGLVLIGSSKVADFSMRIFNADGSEALMCRNASRCIGKYVYDNGLTHKKTVTLETLSGIKQLQLQTNPHEVRMRVWERGSGITQACGTGACATAVAGVRCGYTVVPKEVTASTFSGERVPLNRMWNRRQCTKFNGTSYITQRGAEAIYSPAGKVQIKKTIDYYMTNARIMRESLLSCGLKVYGGENAPYIWLKTPNNLSSWKFFDKLLYEVNIVGTPGVGFGPSGEGYLRLTAFGDRDNTLEAMNRLKKWLL